MCVAGPDAKLQKLPIKQGDFPQVCWFTRKHTHWVNFGAILQPKRMMFLNCFLQTSPFQLPEDQDWLGYVPGVRRLWESSEQKGMDDQILFDVPQGTEERPQCIWMTLNWGNCFQWLNMLECSEIRHIIR